MVPVRRMPASTREPPAASRGGREEGTSVLLTTLIGVGGIGVVAASVVIEAIGDPWLSRRPCPAVVLAVAGVLLVAGQ
jgi:hypothetical protein